LSVAGPNVVVPGTTVINPNVELVTPRVVGPRIRLGYLSVLGTIRAINGNNITIAPTNGAPVSISATPATSITLNGRPITMAELQQNDRAKVSYDPDRNAINLVAVRNP
jgi:hypothetical protein